MPATWQKKCLCFNPSFEARAGNKDMELWTVLLLLWAINSRASLHLQWLRTLCCLWLICLLCLSARQTWPGWRIRRPMPSWGRGRRSGWRRRTPRRNRSAALFGWWGYKYELCHHGGLRALLCKICGCIPVFLSGATNVKPPSIVSGQVNW